MYELLIEDALLRQVIADRESQLVSLPSKDKRRVSLDRELLLLYCAQMRVLCWQQIVILRKHGFRY